MLLAVVVAFTPAGGNAADAILTAITMGFLAGDCLDGCSCLSRQNQLTLAALSDGRRAILYAALGLIALLIAGSDELFSSGGGTLVWILLLGASIAAIWRILGRGQHVLSPFGTKSPTEICVFAHHARVSAWDGRGVSPQTARALAGRMGPLRSS